MKISVFDNIDFLYELKEYDIYSFDMFDTLVFRSGGTPNSIFELVAKECFNTEKERELFVERRIRAEKEVKNHYKEARIDLIYSNISEKYGKDLQYLISKEYACEFDNIYAKESICDFLNEIDINKRIVVSDMYYSGEQLTNILVNCGVFVSDIVVSCESFMTKSRGDLWRKVKRKYENNNIIHFGDSLKGDFIMPILNGIDSVWIGKEGRYIYFEK